MFDLFLMPLQGFLHLLFQFYFHLLGCIIWKLHRLRSFNFLLTFKAWKISMDPSSNKLFMPYFICNYVKKLKCKVSRVLFTHNEFPIAFAPSYPTRLFAFVICEFTIR